MKDPHRLLEDSGLSDVERRSLDAARAVEPPPELASKVWADLVVAVGAAGAAGGVAATVVRAGSAPASTASGTSMSAGVGAKVAVLKALALGATVGAITTGGAVALTSPPMHTGPSSGAASAHVATPERRPRASRENAGEVAASADEAQTPESAASRAPSPHDSVAMPSPEAAHDETTPGSGAPLTRSRTPSRLGEAPASGSSVASFDGAGTGRITNGEASAARTEARLVGIAREALQQRDAARALLVLEDTGRRFPSGILLQEREALAISALAALGRKTESAARAGVFLRAFPTSPHAARVRAAVRGP
jgi:hypothetical protein